MGASSKRESKTCASQVYTHGKTAHYNLLLRACLAGCLDAHPTCTRQLRELKGRKESPDRFPLSPFRPDVAFRRALTFQGFSAFHSKWTQSLQCAAMCRCASQELVVQALAREAQLFLGAELQSDGRNSGARRAQWLSIKPPEHQSQDGDPAEETSAPDRGHPNDKHHTQSLHAALVSLCSFLHRCTPYKNPESAAAETLLPRLVEIMSQPTDDGSVRLSHSLGEASTSDRAP